MVLKNIKKRTLATPVKQEVREENTEVYVRSDYREFQHGVHDDMKGLFFIIKGKHAWKREPSYVNRVSNDVTHIGGYNPNSPSTEEWYQVLDRVCYHSIYCGSDLDKALTAIKKRIVAHKGVAKNYFREVSKYTSDDYYEVHYLGHTPLSLEGRTKKCEGRCPRTSPIMADMYCTIDKMWGNFHIEEVWRMEEEAYKELEDTKPVNRSKKIMKNSKKRIDLQNTARTTTGGQMKSSDLTRKKPLILRKV